MKNIATTCRAGAVALALVASARADAGNVAFSWPEPTQTMRPWVYNWWMGSAVDEPGMRFQCSQMREKGFGGFHVVPIYGAKGGYEKKWRKFLSPEWVDAWNMAASIAKENGLGVDLSMGTGWCFGGPWIDRAHAGAHGMRVKRAGPGGAGYMIDPFDPGAMKIHIAAFDGIFGKGGKAARPRAFYHDSYEYMGSTPKRRGDIDEMQLACFRVWTDWCRANGYATRNQAHGAPSNWLDFYALADIPETEMFGMGSRDILVSKFASSAAHAKGTVLVAAESCTWIDNHFCERPADIKAYIDRLFLSGVNHVFYHGLCYSPVDAPWPGWCFYATLEMNPRNPVWREVGALNAYITRCQSVFQTWTPDTDIAIVWDPAPYRASRRGRFGTMTVTNADQWFYPFKAGRLAKMLFEAGYSFDFISKRMANAGMGKRYAAVVDPEAGGAFDAAMASRGASIAGARRMPFDADVGLVATRWTKDGRTAYFVVNTGSVCRIVTSVHGTFTKADPLSGEVVETHAAAIDPGHSMFLAGDGFKAGKGARPGKDIAGTAIAGPWKLAPLCGGPKLTGPRTLGGLAGWETFDDAFSGTMLYTAPFDCGKDQKAARILSLGDVREIARVRLNGRDLGVKFMPPYIFDIPEGALKEQGNLLEIEVTNLGANRLRWCDANKVAWKYFCDINIVGPDYKPLDASHWKPLKSGLLGPVELLAPDLKSNAPRMAGGAATQNP